MREIQFEEANAVAGGDARAAGQAALLAGGALTLIGAAARTAALVPTPASPALAAFGTVSGLAGAGLGFIGGAVVASNGGGASGPVQERRVIDDWSDLEWGDIQIDF